MKKLDIGSKAIIALVIVGWAPIFAADLFRGRDQAAGFGLAWALVVMPLCMLLAVVVLALKGWESRVKKKK
jgi:hypothetical protein